MTTIDNSVQHKHEFLSQAGSWWRQLLFLGIIGLGLFLLLAPDAWRRSPADTPKDGASPGVSENTNPSDDAQRTGALALLNSRLTHNQVEQGAEAQEGWMVGRKTVSSAQAVVTVQHSQPLDALLLRLKSLSAITAEDAKEIERLLHELRKQGLSAIPAIRDFLRSKEDVDFDKLDGGELLDHHTLRQALFDTLRQIGGDEAMAVSLEQLRETQTPAEIATLARNLEEAAPGVYRAEALQAVSNALQLLVGPREQVEIRPLFELLQDWGGADAVAILAQYPANADAVQYLRNKDTSVSPTWRMYSLLALTELPDGEGIPKLVALAGDPDVPVEHKSELPFQMLAQASMDYAEAGKALIDLARAGQIPDRAWSVVADALEGKYLQFPSQLSGGTLPAKNEADVSGVEAPFLVGYYDDERNIKYEQRAVSADWSDAQVRQQIALIDKLIRVTSSPAAVTVLQQARAALQRNS